MTTLRRAIPKVVTGLEKVSARHHHHRRRSSLDVMGWWDCSASAHDNIPSESTVVSAQEG